MFQLVLFHRVFLFSISLCTTTPMDASWIFRFAFFLFNSSNVFISFFPSGRGIRFPFSDGWFAQVHRHLYPFSGRSHHRLACELT